MTAPPAHPRPSAAALHASALVVDAHSDVAQVMLDEGRDVGRRLRATHFDLARAARGHLAAQLFALWVEPDVYTGEAAWARTRALVAAVEGAAAAHPARLGLARTAADIRALNAAGRLAAVLAVEGAHALGTDDPATVLARVAALAARGVRCFGLTWNNSNALASSAVDPRDGGLTDLGRRVVHDLQRRGVLVDVSHASDATVRDLLRHARRPIVATHSNARALCQVARNLPDHLVRAIARSGGVVCATFFAGFVDLPTFERLQRLKALMDARPRRGRADALPPARRHAALRRAARAALRTLPQVPLRRLVAHIVHLAAVAGPDHVGLGSDFDGMWMPVAGLEDVAALPRLTAALRPHFSDEEVRGILGGNLLRLLADAGG